MSGLVEVLAAGGLTSVFQPIVDLDTGAVVAYEALARGPQGPWERPDVLFAAARREGLLAVLDEACRRAAFRGAVTYDLLAPLHVFVNVEPEVLDHAPLDDLLQIAATAPGELRVVLEITERALATRPADLLRTVRRVREIGWGVALDDVGADVLSLAFMPLLRPDVVKLDLRLVQSRPGPQIAEIMNAVNAYAERTGALVLAEGIEDEQHLVTARALGARLGQGWLFGRPAAGRAVGPRQRPSGGLRLPTPPSPPPAGSSPFGCLPPGTPLRRSPKVLLIELSKQLEREAMRLGRTCVVAATFQEARNFTPSTAQRYRDLVERTGFVAALGEDLAVEPVPGVRGAQLAVDDPVRGEWDLVVLSPHFSAALLARDLGDTGPDLERMFEYALTYDRDTVVAAAQALLLRVVPRLPGLERLVPENAPRAIVAPVHGAPDETPALPAAGSEAGGAAAAHAETLLQRALAATSSGVAIVDMLRPDQPLVYVNAAFEALSGFRADQVLGRNCRFLQGPDTDPGAVSRIRAALDEGRECRETLLNHRGHERTPWWNDIVLAPVVDDAGQVVQYIGVQHDVSGQVQAQRQLAVERDRASGYLQRLEQLAFSDPLTGLANRRRLEDRVETALWDARADGTGLALLYLDLDGFKAVNDRLGHAAGDALLVSTADRLRQRLRRSDLLARLGGDEFLVAVLGLDRDSARAEAERIGAELREDVARPVDVGPETVTVTASLGVSVYPHDGEDLGALRHLADLRMYASKHPERVAT